MSSYVSMDMDNASRLFRKMAAENKERMEEYREELPTIFNYCKGKMDAYTIAADHLDNLMSIHEEA